MPVIHSQGSNLMATLCRDAERCSRRSIQINQQCHLCLNQALLKRLHAEQHSLEGRLSDIRRVIAEIDREVALDPLALDFASEVARRAIVKIQSSVN